MWEGYDRHWYVDKQKVRAKSLRRLIELFEDAKHDFIKGEGYYDTKAFLEYLASPCGYPFNYEEIVMNYGIDFRTAYDYINAIRAIAKLLLDEEERDGCHGVAKA